MKVNGRIWKEREGGKGGKGREIKGRIGKKGRVEKL